VTLLKTNKFPDLVKVFSGRKGYLEVPPICNLILILLLLCQIQHPQALAEIAFSYNYKDLKPVKVFSPSSKTCGSGLLSGQLLLTNAHVANSFCRKDSCSNLELSSVNNKLVKILGSEIQILRISSTLDLALLKITQKVDEFDSPGLSFDAELTAISFPHCGKAQISKGQILENLSNLYISTNLGLSHGSSGAGVFDRNGRLAGIVSESEDVFGALKSLALSQNFEASRLVPQSQLQIFLSATPDQLFETQTQFLLDYHKDQVSEKTGLARIIESARFINKTKHLTLENINHPHSKLILAGFASPAFPFFADVAATDTSAALLGLVLSLEKNGPYKSLVSQINSSELDQIKDNLVIHSKFISAITEKMLATNFKGIESELLVLIIKVILTGLGFLCAFLIMVYLTMFKMTRLSLPIKLIVFLAQIPAVLIAWILATKSLIE
jgi:hypothetical protein